MKKWLVCEVWVVIFADVFAVVLSLTSNFRCDLFFFKCDVFLSLFFFFMYLAGMWNVVAFLRGRQRGLCWYCVAVLLYVDLIAKLWRGHCVF